MSRCFGFCCIESIQYHPLSYGFISGQKHLVFENACLGVGSTVWHVGLSVTRLAGSRNRYSYIQGKNGQQAKDVARRKRLLLAMGQEIIKTKQPPKSNLIQGV